MDWFDIVFSLFLPRRTLSLVVDPLDRPDYGFSVFLRVAFVVVALLVNALAWIGVPVLRDHPIVIGAITFVVVLLVWTVAPGYTALKARRSIQETGDRWERRNPELRDRKRRRS